MINLNIFNPILEYYRSIGIGISIDIAFGYYRSGAPWTNIQIYIPDTGIIYDSKNFVQKEMVKELKKAYQFLTQYSNDRFKIEL